jgi:hypothetical protein
MNNNKKFIIGAILLLLALSLITAGCEVAWGTSGALIGAGIMSAIYGWAALQAIK